MTDSGTLVALALIFLALDAAVGMSLRELRSLYDECAGHVMAVALQLLRDRAEAEDVVQETFLEVWRRAASFDPARGTREALAVLIARSRALDRIRARGSAARAAERVAADPPAPAPAPTEVHEVNERGKRIRAALAALPPPQREAVELAYFGGLSQSEIAARAGEPLGTVKTRLRLAMEKLSEALREEAA